MALDREEILAECLAEFKRGIEDLTPEDSEEVSYLIDELIENYVEVDDNDLKQEIKESLFEEWENYLDEINSQKYDFLDSFEENE